MKTVIEALIKSFHCHALVNRHVVKKKKNYFCTFTLLFSEGIHWWEHKMDIVKNVISVIENFFHSHSQSTANKHCNALMRERYGSHKKLQPLFTFTFYRKHWWEINKVQINMALIKTVIADLANFFSKLTWTFPGNDRMIWLSSKQQILHSFTFPFSNKNIDENIMS